MKKISNLKGIKILSKKEQNEINGSMFSRPYCKGNNQCCVDTPSGFTFCDYGYCVRGGCIWA